MTFWKTAAWTFALLMLGVAGYYGYSFIDFANDNPEESRFHHFERQENGEADPVAYAPPTWEGTERVNVLLLGGDSRGLAKNEIPRSDTMMVASIDPTTKRAHLFSILRDTYVEIPGHGSERINSAIVLGGPKLTMRTVGELLGLDIQYYVYTDFEGFVKLVDEIGGIEFEVEKDMRYSSRADGPEYDIRLEAGLQHLDGHEALQYVRFRHDALSDFARTERQRNFLTAVAEKLQTTSSVLRLPRILSSIDPYIETNLSVTEMLKLGALGFEAKAQQVQGVQVPPSNLLQEVTRGGAAVLTVNEQRLREYVKEKLAEPPPLPERDERGSAAGTQPDGEGEAAAEPS